MLRYFGKVCVKHPELKGERRKANCECMGCRRERSSKWNKETNYMSNYMNNYVKERKHKDPLFHLIKRMRTLVGMSLHSRGHKKNTKTFDILGCTPAEFFDYIESKFTGGMSWENRNKWDIDHIIPLASATTEEEIIRLNHYTNLTPLWKLDNQKKGSVAFLQQLPVYDSWGILCQSPRYGLIEV